MKQLVLAPLKAYLGDDYPRLRSRAVVWQDILTNRAKNLRFLVSDVTPLKLEPARLEQVKRGNRAALRAISRWYDPAWRTRSVCNYGISLDKVHLLDTEIGAETTLSDLITYYCSELSAPIRYLEIGVSVGKNFVQVMNTVPSGSFTGFDIEDINPSITSDLKPVSREEWPALDPVAARRASGGAFVREAPSSFEVYDNSSQSKTIRYLSGDIFDDRCWAVLGREKYNVIFSDAMHRGAAIKHEYAMMGKHTLFSGVPLLIVWDDLQVPGMRDAFLEITDDLLRTFAQKRASRAMHLVYGWAGRNEGFRHLVGVFRAT